MNPSVPSESFWQLDRLEFFDLTAQFQHGIERFRRRAVREAGGAGCPAQPGFAPHQPMSRSTAPIRGPAVPDNRRRLRRRSRDDSLAPRPIGCGSLTGGRGAIATGWWPWHPRLISRDASRVQWIDMHHQVGGLAGLRCHRNNLASLMNRGSTWVAGERSGQMRPYVRPVSWGSPLAIMGVRLRVRHQSQPRAQGTMSCSVLPELS
jgi:hypothetical protein